MQPKRKSLTILNSKYEVKLVSWYIYYVLSYYEHLHHDQNIFELKVKYFLIL